jgi:hypothetical protein
VHEGHDPSQDEAARAVLTAWELVEAMGEQLRDLSDFPHVGAQLRLAWHPADE